MACRARLLRSIPEGTIFHFPRDCGKPQDGLRADKFIDAHEDMEVSERDGDGWSLFQGGRGCRLRGDMLVHTRE
ncbi:hypothetical protein HY634_03600 [Candidatus Uhrbacteria bacterium]|nr:hypothetical protein [Candidatus Uhrbacteria bacterium]